ncbi:MAG: heat-inducible transcriptional repressor HrcA [bacterium]|nr:heat-inducible transcription repressor HrcA [Gemmatimonadota bacterium]
MTREETSEITSREAIVLGTIVREYVASARAVGSRWVARQSGLDLSPASIRNCMMDLEDKGLLTHRHTSGGRFPTHLGYRRYVDAVMKRAQLGRRQQRSVDEALAPRFSSLERLFEAVCVTLGQHSDQLSVVLSPRYDSSVVDRVELNQVDERRVLVVFRMTSGIERTIVRAVEGTVGSDDLRESLLFVNSNGRGRTLAALAGLLEQEEMKPRLRGLALARAVFGAARELAESETAEHFHLWGTSNILAQPEFEDRDRLREMFRALEERKVLAELFEPTRHRRNVCITIGEENPVEALRDCSVVAGSYRFGEFGGSVGVIGPTRMPYEQVVALVDYVAAAVGTILQRN